MTAGQSRCVRLSNNIILIQRLSRHLPIIRTGLWLRFFRDFCLSKAAVSLSSSFLAPFAGNQIGYFYLFIYVSPGSAERKTNKSQDGQRSENETAQGISDRMSLGKTKTYRMQTSAEAEVPLHWICFVGTLWKYMKRQKSNKNNITFWDTLMFLLLWDYFFYCSFHLHQPPSLLRNVTLLATLLQISQNIWYFGSAVQGFT